MPVSGGVRESPAAICHCLPAASPELLLPQVQVLQGRNFWAVLLGKYQMKHQWNKSAAQIPLPFYGALLPLVNRFQCLIESGCSLAAFVLHHEVHRLKGNNGVSSGQNLTKIKSKKKNLIYYFVCSHNNKGGNSFGVHTCGRN